MNLPNNLSLAPRSQVDRTELKALQHFSQYAEQQKLRYESLCKKHGLVNHSEHVGNFAEPLSPLRERDLTALESLFQRSDMYAIETDINQMLLHLLPEPCWEEDAFEFLREFL